jgi:DNA-directed RNA polymerase specialized sigma24 family protein
MSLVFAVAVAVDMATLEAVPADGPDVFEVVAGRWEAAVLWSAVRALPRRERDVVALRYGLVCAPLQWSDICLVLRCSDRSARRAEQRGLNRLRETASARLAAAS